MLYFRSNGHRESILSETVNSSIMCVGQGLIKAIVGVYIHPSWAGKDRKFMSEVILDILCYF